MPRGAVMAAAGLLQSMLGFNETSVSLMIALYLAQDSLGTATNVTGDGALTMLIHRLTSKKESEKRKMCLHNTEKPRTLPAPWLF